ncbi:outer membrane beta-barrel protein [Niabella pedocola]|uniref:Outer membrane beta-barrel protein n=1 Tax=Niabella pedocola TaxID=1752077 RepID=A0ABS8PWU6_9BACT|nr:outer membrane beta-barrel protein [Niabella pedocola]MCD2425525.1 outer membrane beta-barrel protein [Niabella pedocola]
MNKFRFLLLLLLISGSTLQLSAQWKGFSIGPYGEYAVPQGDFGTNFNWGVGVGGTADIRLIKKLALTGSVGYMYFRGADRADDAGNPYRVYDLKAVPIRVGLKYRLIPLLYVKLEAGSANYSGNHYDGSAFILSPGVGLRILGFDLQAKYEAWMKDGTKGFIGFKAGWNF